jgi:hypothetical protein
MSNQLLPFSFFISLIVFIQTAGAQHAGGSIQGKVVNADGNPAYVTIELKEFKKITVTNNTGQFTLTNLPALTDTIRISSVGSLPTELTV